MTPQPLRLDRLTALFGQPPALAQARRAAFVNGMRAYTPAAIATGAWALVTGVATVRMGLHLGQSLAMSAFVYAGSAQLASLPLIAAGAPIWLILLTATIVNLRFVIFSAGLHPYFRHLSLTQRLVLGYLTSDVGYLLVIRRWGGGPHEGADRTEQTWFFLGLSVANWFTWQSMSVVGILMADRIPPAWGMDFIGVLALITLVVPGLTDAPAVVGVLVACVVAVLANALPLKLSVLAAVVAGVTAAMATEVVRERRGAGR
ncbi:MAG TPA: AzlC family ABC transporter permease [Burkholderiaceae bacterium]|jgi:predicted branched-subunit amino acid permease|nr:AzlC family ABC transporter permease [Burkholderiaceae bacterium]